MTTTIAPTCNETSAPVAPVAREHFDYNEQASSLVSAMAKNHAWRFKGQHSVEDLEGILMLRWARLSAKYAPTGMSFNEFHSISKLALRNQITDELRQRFAALDRGELRTKTAVQSGSNGSQDAFEGGVRRTEMDDSAALYSSSLGDAESTQLMVEIQTGPPAVQAFFQNAQKNGAERRRLPNNTLESLAAMCNRVAGDHGTRVLFQIEKHLGFPLK